MKIVLTLQLQQDNGTPVFTGTEEKTAFVQGDYGLVRGFLSSAGLSDLVRYMGWIASGRVPTPAGQTVLIRDLG